MPQGPPNIGFMQEKVQKGDFLKKPSRELNFFLLFQVPMNLSKAWNTKLEAVVFLLYKILYNQSVYNTWPTGFVKLEKLKKLK